MESGSEQALIIAVRQGSGADRLLVCLTRSRGKVRLYARRLPGRRRTASFAGPLQGGEAVFLRPSPRNPGRLLSFEPRRVWPRIREDLGRTVEALAFLELLELCAVEEEPAPELFALAVRFLNRLELGARPVEARIAATLQLLRIAGFAPHLDACQACGRPAPAGTSQGFGFSPEGGGLVCAACAAARRERPLPVSGGALGFMRRCLRDAGAGRLRAGPRLAAEIDRLLDPFLAARLGVRPRAALFREKMPAPA